MFLPSWNESDPVSLDSFLVLSGLVQCLLRVSSLPFDIAIDLKVKATSSNILTRAFYISIISFEEIYVICRLGGPYGEKL